MLIDSHAHITSSVKRYSDINAVIKRAKESGVEKIIDASIDIPSSKAAPGLSCQYPEILVPTIGIHPEKMIPGSDIFQQDINIATEMQEMEKVFNNGGKSYKAIGECGLDYYWMNKNSKFKTKKIRKLQIELFKRQVEFALRVNLPIVVHSRGAESECFSIISDTIRSGSIDTLFHCYTGSLEVAKEILQAGYYISFNGILTFKNADLVREVFLFAWKNYPELILSETDAPLLAPEPKRGEICEPADVKLVVKKMAEISGVSFEEAAEVTSRNARKFYTL